MLTEVTCKCPICGKKWQEEQDTDDEWYGLALGKILCDECNKIEVKKLHDKWVTEIFGDKVRRWLKELNDNAFANAPNDGDIGEYRMYKQGLYDGLRMVIDIITGEGG